MIVPLVMITLMLLVQGLFYLEFIPSVNELTVWVSRSIFSIGVWMIFLFSIIEHTLIFNVYFPGALAILIGMGNTSENPSEILPTFVAIVLGQLTGYSISYLMGRLSGMSVLNANVKLRTWQSYMLSFVSYGHPHSGAVTSFQHGYAGLSLIKFLLLLLLCLSFWSPFWAFVAYAGLLSVVDSSGWDVIFYTYLMSWIFIIVFKRLFFAPSIQQ